MDARPQRHAFNTLACAVGAKHFHDRRRAKKHSLPPSNFVHAVIEAHSSLAVYFQPPAGVYGGSSATSYLEQPTVKEVPACGAERSRRMHKCMVSDQIE